MPPNTLFPRRLGLVRATVLLLCVTLSSCAKFPASTGLISAKRVTFTFTVDGQINPNYVYIVALRPSDLLNPIDQGPVPSIAPPWGNGFVAGNCTYFVRWDPTTSPAYTIYQFRDAQLTQYFPMGIPVTYTDVLTGGRTIQFDLDLSQIATSPADADAYQSLQVNFLTMDRVPQGSTGNKVWEGLGDGNSPSQVNTWITIPLNTNGIYNNARYGNLEPKGDTPLPDIDIVDFSVSVRSS